MMISSVLLPFLLAAAPQPDRFQMADICFAQLAGGEVLLVHSDMRTATLVDLKDIEIVQPMRLNPFGFPVVTVGVGSTPGNPNTIESSYESKVASHTVVTNCKGMSELLCAEKHKKQLEALQKVFPKKQ